MEEAAKVLWGPIKTVLIDNLQRYKKYLDEYDTNMFTLRQNLDDLYSGKQDIEGQVLAGKDRLEKITGRAELWLEQVSEMTKDDELKMLMLGDIEVAKAALMLMEADLRELVEVDCEIRDIVANVMKDISKSKSKSKRRTDDNSHTNDRAKRNRDVSKILEKVVKETIEEFKRLMKSDPQMAVAAMQLLDGHGDLDKITKDDQEMAEIVNDAKKFTVVVDGDENLSKENRLYRGTFRTKVRNMLRPVGEIMMNDAFMKALPETVSLGAGIMMSTIGNRDGLANEINKTEDGKRQRRRCCCTVCFEHYRDRYQLSLAAESMANKIKPLIEKRVDGTAVTVAIRAAEMEAIPTNFVGLESREQLLQEVLEALTDENVDVVGVYGMGGTGKTTLAKEVANSKAKGVFDTIVMVEISEAPNIERIQDHIADALGLPLSDVHSIPQRAIKLYNRLKSEVKKDKGKTLLMILDNIWHKLNLDEVGIPRDNCKILLTTREENICIEMGVKKLGIFKVGMLNDKEANDLFESQVGNLPKNEDHKSMGKRLVSKCGGLPLTIVTIANALKGKPFPMWRQFADELEKPIPSQVDGVHHETYLVLETSYKLMESEEKKMLFLLACLCPIGSTISVDDLMRYGIGFDLFQHVNKLSEAMDQADKWVDELISSSMLLEGDTMGHVKIHDVVRASTISFAKKDNHTFLVESIPRWMCEETLKKYTAISLVSQTNYHRLDGLISEKLEILILKGNLSSKSLSSSFFDGMKNLKILSLSNMNFEQGLPKSTENLWSTLRTLILQGCKLGDIRVIGKLMKLSVLSLRNSLLKELPIEIGNLLNLRLLDLNGCNTATFPKLLIFNLSNLEGLYLLGCTRERQHRRSGKGTESLIIEEVNKLHHLNVLEIDVFMSGEDFSMDNRIVEGLAKSRIIVFGGHGDYERSGYQTMAVGRHVLKLKGDLVRYGPHLGRRVMNRNCRRALLKRVEHLIIDNYRFNESDVKVTDLISYLNVDIVKTNELKSGMFSKLQGLELTSLKELQYLLPISLVPHLLTKIKVVECDDLKFLFIDDQPADEEDLRVIELRYLKSLEITGGYRTSNLVSIVGPTHFSTDDDEPFFCRKMVLPSLEQLELRNNSMVKKLWSEEVDTSTFQNLKVIRLKKCRKLQSLGPETILAGLVRLELLDISDCEKMQEVITKITQGEQEIKTIIFPELKEIRICANKSVVGFYAGNYALEFPRLITLHLSELSKFSGTDMMTIYFPEQLEFPSLEELIVRSVHEDVSGLWNWEGKDPLWNPVPNLRKLTVGFPESAFIPPIVSKNLQSLNIDFNNEGDTQILFSSTRSVNKSMWAYQDFPNLEFLSLGNSKSLKKLFETDDDDDYNHTEMLAFWGGLKRIKISGFRELNMVPACLHIFKSIRSLQIGYLNWEVLFPDTVSNNLIHLDDLEVSNCDKMEFLIRNDEPKCGGGGGGGGGGEQELISSNVVVVFPRLKRLQISDLSISKFSSRPESTLCLPSLEELVIKSCDKLKSFWVGPFSAPKLQQILISACKTMQYFLTEYQNTLVEFPCLQSVKISRSYYVKSFCSRPVMAVPNLTEVDLYDCDDMECFMIGNPNDSYMELPSLNSVDVRSCPSLLSFSSLPVRSPELTRLRINSHECSIHEISDIDQFIKSCYRTKEQQLDDIYR